MFWHISTGFYYFIKDKNLIWGEIASKFAKMVNYFVSIPNLQISKERMELARRLRGNSLIQISKKEFDARIKVFHRV